jgi:hypothetical protein
MGARAMSAKKMSRDALTVRALDAAHDQLSRLTRSWIAEEKHARLRKRRHRSRSAPSAPKRDNAYEACAGKGERQTRVEHVVE